MKAISLSDVANWSGGALIQGTPASVVAAVSTDSRSVGEEDLFVALVGDRFDAHDFLEQVGERSAAAILVSQLTAATEQFSGAIIHVRDTLKGLQDLARGFRRSLSDLRVVGLTGSNGKTSTKDFLSGVLSTQFSVTKTQGNLNNHIGVPLSILSAEADHDYAVWEMGMSHPGEIEVLAEIARPNVGVITNIGTAHIENMGTRDAIAEEKSQLAWAIDAAGYCVMPSHDDYVDFVSGELRCELITVGFEQGQVRAESLQTDANGHTAFSLVSEFGEAVPVQLPVRGRHMVSNALLAAAVGLKEGVAGAQIAQGLASVSLTGGRLEECEVSGIPFLNDSYNANPDSMAAALIVLKEASVAGRRVAVLGHMAELGEFSDQAHRSLGETLSANGVDVLVTVGETAGLINTAANGVAKNENFQTHEKAAEFLRSELTSDDLVLVKGSRSAAMERVIEGLR